MWAGGNGRQKLARSGGIQEFVAVFVVICGMQRYQKGVPFGTFACQFKMGLEYGLAGEALCIQGRRQRGQPEKIKVDAGIKLKVARLRLCRNVLNSVLSQ